MSLACICENKCGIVAVICLLSYFSAASRTHFCYKVDHCQEHADLHLGHRSAMLSLSMVPGMGPTSMVSLCLKTYEQIILQSFPLVSFQTEICSWFCPLFVLLFTNFKHDTYVFYHRDQMFINNARNGHSVVLCLIRFISG